MGFLTVGKPLDWEESKKHLVILLILDSYMLYFLFAV